MPKISIVMAVYNGMPFLPQAIESVLAQTFSNFEFIIVNDCSTDQSRACIEGYDDERIRLINLEENGGQTAALNRGLQSARAPYIARQDADDRSKPERLARQVDFLESHPDYWLVGTSADLIDERNRVSGISSQPETDEAIRAQFDAHSNAFYHGSVMFRRDVLEAVGLYREGFRTSQDYDYWVRISEHGKVCNLQSALYQYRLHEGQMTFTSYYRMKAEWQLVQELRLIRQRGEDDRAAYEQGAQDLTRRFTDFVPTRVEERRAMAELWRGKGVSYMTSGHYPAMLACLVRAFWYEPLNPDFWRGVRNHIPGLK